MIRAGDGVRAEILGFDGGRAVLDLRTPARTYGRVPLALRGRHQASNAVVAVRLLEEIDRLGTRVGADGVVAALGATRWPGRLDLLTDATGRQVLCDSAHNPAGARALAEYLREFHPAGLPIVFGIMKDKDVAGTLAPLIPFASRLFLTRAHTDRALPLGALAETARRLGRDVPSEIEPDPVMALERAWNHARLVCAAGSIFVVGELVGRLRPDDRRPPGGAH
jgi:dihydrofolate synthase/folylpolyglutamate synthase